MKTKEEVKSIKTIKRNQSKGPRDSTMIFPPTNGLMKNSLEKKVNTKSRRKMRMTLMNKSITITKLNLLFKKRKKKKKKPKGQKKTLRNLPPRKVLLIVPKVIHI